MRLDKAVFFGFFFCVFCSVANATRNFDNLTPQEGDLFHPNYGHAAEILAQYVISNPNHTYYGSTCSAAYGAALNTHKASRPDNAGVDKWIWGAKVSGPYDSTTYCSKGIEYVYKTFNQNGSVKTETSGTALIVDASMVLEDVPQCPPDGYSQYFMHAKMADTHYCFSPIELRTRDSCPDDGEYGKTMLPLGTNSSDRVCKTEPDGSVCEYNLTVDDTAYGSVPSSFCYTSPELADYIEEPLPVLDESETAEECQDLGFGTPSCVEDPANVCDSSGACQEGCGYVETSAGSAFVCLSGDTDNDGVPDYKDPDKDGDGIKNEDDLDSDGDGVDDPIDTANTTTNLLREIAINTGKIANNGSGGGGGDPSNGSEIGEVETEGEGGSYTTNEELQIQIDEAELELLAVLETAQESLETMLSIGSQSSSFFGCYDVVSFRGSTKQSCANNYEDEMQILATALLFIFALIAVIIVIR